MTYSMIEQRHIEMAKQYFLKGDAGDQTILNMFTDNVQLYFPKFGTRSGKGEVIAFIRGLLGKLESLKHEVDTYNYIASGNLVVVEGTESGVMKDGTTWPVAGGSEGRFCNVFEFDGDLITRVHIYVDPDFAGEDHDRFYWR